MATGHRRRTCPDHFIEIVENIAVDIQEGFKAVNGWNIGQKVIGADSFKKAVYCAACAGDLQI